MPPAGTTEAVVSDERKQARIGLDSSWASALRAARFTFRGTDSGRIPLDYLPGFSPLSSKVSVQARRDFTGHRLTYIFSLRIMNFSFLYRS